MIARLIGFFLCYTTIMAAQATELPTDSLLSLAQQHLDSLAYQEAIQLTEQVIKTTANASITQLILAHTIQGDVYREQGQYEEAITQYSRSKENSLRLPEQPSLMLAQANNDLGLCHWHKKELSTAENYFKEALQMRLQVLGAIHPKVADSYNNLGNCAFDKRDLTTARDFYEKSLTIREQTLEKDHIDIASIYNNLGSCYRLAGQFETAIDYFANSLRIRELKLGKLHPKVAQSCNNLGRCYEQMEAIETALSYYERGLAIYQAIEMGQHPDKATSYLGIGSCYSKLRNHQKALDFFKKALVIQQTVFGAESANLISVYNNLANAYKNLGDYNQAMLFYENNIHLLNQSFGKQHPFTAATLVNIGLIQVELDAYDKALESYQLALAIYQQREQYHRMAETWNNIGTCLRQQKKYTQAIQAYQRSSSIFEQLYGPTTSNNATVFYNIANCLGEEERFEEAIAYYQKSQALSNKIPSKLAVYATSIGTIYQKQNQLEAALEKYEEAQALLQIDLQVDDNLAYIQSPTEVISLLNAKAKTLLQQASLTTSREQLLEILKTIDFTAKIITQLKQQFQEEYSKRKLSELTYQTFEIGIAAATRLFKDTQDQQYLEKAFRYSEQSRSSLVLEEKLSQKAAQIANIPDSLLEKESQLKASIAYYEKQKFTDTLERSQKNFNNIIFKQKQAYQQLIQELEDQYPAYYQLKYKDALVTIETLQNTLHPKEAIIEYFVSDTLIYTFLIQSQKATLTTIVIDSLVTEVKLLREGITRYYMDYDTQSEQGYRTLLIQYLRVAHFLYQKLIQPISNELPEYLTIINSRVLHYLPFDALVTDLPKGALHRLRDINYLIKQHEINYASSATLFYNERVAPALTKAPKQLLALAPTFTFPNDLGLAPLSYNIKEVEQIQSLFPAAQIYTDTAAIKETFLQVADNFEILHLATHAKADADLGDYSFLAFANQKSKNVFDRVLYAKDIYQLGLKARLVVLSACETGTGELLQGEGIVSLARAFIYGGARSIVTTLWSINDATTKQFISSFYTYLKKGETVGTSLRQAKLQYIEEADDPNPFFWAAFTLTGESVSLEETATDDSLPRSILLFLACLSILLFLVYFFERKKS